MHPRRFARALAILAVILVTAWLFTPKPSRPPVAVVDQPAAATPNAAGVPPPLRPGAAAPSSAVLAAPSAAASRAGSPVPPPAVTPLPAAAAATLPDAVGPDAASVIAVDQARLMLRDYRTLMGENPIGTNAEIMRALMGDNPRQATVGPPEGQKLNDQGELVDRWGTPLFFHQLSKTVMEIRSAGPDKIMWTDDDIVAQ